MNFHYLCSLLPAEIMWNDVLTPQIVENIATNVQSESAQEI